MGLAVEDDVMGHGSGMRCVTGVQVGKNGDRMLDSDRQRGSPRKGVPIPSLLSSLCHDADCRGNHLEVDLLKYDVESRTTGDGLEELAPEAQAEEEPEVGAGSLVRSRDRT
jgi:hypothetical protein